MIMLRRGVVTAVEGARPGAVELRVDVDGRSATALAYPDLCGAVDVGDTVLLNTTAVALDLGTGGVHLVVAVLDDAPSRGDDEAPGRVMKLRYTPEQTAVAAVEETHRDRLEGSPSPDGVPVVCAPAP